MRTHNFINGFKGRNKQDDKIIIGFRIGRLTILDLNVDFSEGYFKLMIINLGYETKH